MNPAVPPFRNYGPLVGNLLATKRVRLPRRQRDMHPNYSPASPRSATGLPNPNDSARQRGLRPAERNGLDSLTRHEGNTSYVKSHSKFRNVDPAGTPSLWPGGPTRSVTEPDKSILRARLPIIANATPIKVMLA